MAGLTFGGKSATQVAIRSSLLPPPDLAGQAKQDKRRSQDAGRFDGYIQAARWRGEQVNWLRHRIARLQPIQDRHAAWLDAHDWRHPRWQKRNGRYWTVAHSIAAHDRQIRGFIEKVFDLTAKKPAAQQEAISGAYFEALSGPPPARKPPAVMEMAG